MVNSILTSAGIPGRRSRFPKPPAGTYAVWLDDITTDGPDGIPAILTHDVTIELYEPAPDDEKETALEAALTAAGLQWTKEDRYWLQTEQRYQVLFEFSYMEKKEVLTYGKKRQEDNHPGQRQDLPAGLLRHHAHSGHPLR